MTKEEGPNVVLVAVAAAAVGAVVALLFAPQGGSKTRREIRTQAKHMKRRANEGAEIAREVASEASERFQEVFSNVAEDTKTVATAARKAARHTTGSVKDASNDVEVKARDAWGRAAK